MVAGQGEEHRGVRRLDTLALTDSSALALTLVLCDEHGLAWLALVSVSKALRGKPGGGVGPPSILALRDPREGICTPGGGIRGGIIAGRRLVARAGVRGVVASLGGGAIDPRVGV